MDTPNTYIFIGRSGCGKGTQADLLRKKLAVSSQFPVVDIQTGNIFREFIKRKGITAERSRELMRAGARQPDFLAIWIWSGIFMERTTLDENWILDGAPRGLSEAMALETAMEFYGRAKPAVIYVNVSRAWASARLMGRGRADDEAKEIENRQTYFDVNVVPALEFYRKSPNCDFLEINGEQPIEAVKEQIFAKLTAAGKL